MEFQANAAFVDLIKRTNGVRWAKFTLHSTALSSGSDWNICLKNTFSILRRTYPVSSVKSKRKAEGMPPLFYLTYMGGNRRDESHKRTIYHAQGLIEVMGNDPVQIKLNKCLDTAWKHSVLSRLGINRETAEPTRLEKILKESPIWTSPLIGLGDCYLFYTSRGEGNDFGFGVDKIVLDATSLPPGVMIRD